MENKATTSVIAVAIAIFVISIFFGFSSILMFAPIVIMVVIGVIAGNVCGLAKNKSNNPTANPTSMHDMYQYQNTCGTNKTEDDFCHNQHQAERLIPDDMRSELEELRSLLDSGLMERPEYNDRVKAIRTQR